MTGLTRDTREVGERAPGGRQVLAVDVRHHLHHLAGDFLRFLVVERVVELRTTAPPSTSGGRRSARVCGGSSRCSSGSRVLGMAVLATDTEPHGELPHDRRHLVPRHVLRKHLQVLRRLTAASATPLSPTLGQECPRHGEQQQKRKRRRTELAHGDWPRGVGTGRNLDLRTSAVPEVLERQRPALSVR